MSKINTDPKIIEEILTRSVAQIYPSKEELRQMLLSGKRLRVYIGADATGPDLHIGHATNFILLEKLRNLGHEIIVLFGDFTAMIGDPTDKMATRKVLTRSEVDKNIRTWKSQVSKVVKLNDKKNPAKILKHSTWLSKLKFEEIIKIASNFTVQRMLERDMFEKRLNEGKPIHFHEFFYPLMQGYDSVAMDVDLEVGGTDQTFNMLAGRTLQKIYHNKEKFVLTTTLLENPVTGERLMSKSLGGYIGMNDEPNEMYGKVMAYPDPVMHQIFVDCTNLSLKEIENIEKEFCDNPRDLKMQLAKTIVQTYHSNKDAQDAQEEFVRTFQKKETPMKVEEVNLKKEKVNALELFTLSGLVSSKSEVKRLITQGGLKVNNKMVQDESQEFSLPKEGLLLQKGKRFFVRVKHS